MWRLEEAGQFMEHMEEYAAFSNPIESISPPIQYPSINIVLQMGSGAESTRPLQQTIKPQEKVVRYDAGRVSLNRDGNRTQEHGNTVGQIIGERLYENVRQSQGRDDTHEPGKALATNTSGHNQLNGRIASIRKRVNEAKLRGEGLPERGNTSHPLLQHLPELAKEPLHCCSVCGQAFLDRYQLKDHYYRYHIQSRC